MTTKGLLRKGLSLSLVVFGDKMRCHSPALEWSLLYTVLKWGHFGKWRVCWPWERSSPSGGWYPEQRWRKQCKWGPERSGRNRGYFSFPSMLVCWEECGVYWDGEDCIWAHISLILKDPLPTQPEELGVTQSCSSLLAPRAQLLCLRPCLYRPLSYSHLRQNFVSLLFWPWLHFLASDFLSPSQLINSEMARGRKKKKISPSQSAPGNTLSVFYSTLHFSFSLSQVPVQKPGRSWDFCRCTFWRRCLG